MLIRRLPSTTEPCFRRLSDGSSAINSILRRERFMRRAFAAIVLLSSFAAADSFFAVNSQTNSLTTVGSGTTAIQGTTNTFNSSGLTFDTANGFLYGISNNGSDYFFNKISTGGVVNGAPVDLSTQTGFGNTGFFGLAYDRTNADVLGLTQDTLGGALGLVTIGLDGHITQSSSLTGPLGVPFPGGSGLTFDTGGNLYTIGISTNDGTPTLFSISGGVIAAKQSYGLNGLNISGGLAYSNNSFFGISNDGGNSELLTFGIGSSAQTPVTLLDNQGDYFGGLAVAPSVSAVPEPGTLTLMLTSFGGALFRFRRHS
jgi:hypothetical protein